jgi:hypothetical protein
LSGIVVWKSGVQEGKVSEPDQKSRGNDIFSISSIVDQSILFVQSVAGFHDCVYALVVNMEMYKIVFCIEIDGDSIKITLRISRFSSNERNCVKERSIIRDGLSDTSIFVEYFGCDRSVRKGKI